MAPGVDALARAISAPARSYPRDVAGMTAPAVNALFQTDGALADGAWREAFTPTYDVMFPEHLLTALSPENLIVDLSPIPTVIGGKAHLPHHLGTGKPFRN